MRFLIPCALCLLTLPTLAQSEPPPEPEPASEPTLTAALDLGEIVDVVQAGSIVYAAPASGGVVIIDVSDEGAPRVVGRLAEGQAVVRLLLDGDRLWIVVLNEQIQSYSIADPLAPVTALPTRPPRAPPPVSASPAPPPPLEDVTHDVEPEAAEPAAQQPSLPKIQAHVQSVTGGRVIFDGGAEAGFEVGMHVRIVSQRLVAKPDLTNGGNVEVPSGEVTAVVEVEEIGPSGAMAKLGRGDVAEPGDLVEPTAARLSESIFLPRRAPFWLRAGFHARPFLGLNTEDRKPFGMLVDAYATWYLDIVPIALTGEISPAGFTLFSGDAHYPVVLTAIVSYYTDWFEIGLGGGGMIGNEGPCQPEWDPETGLPTTTAICEQNNGFTVNQMLRLGPIDGIHLTWNSSIFSRPEQFVFGVGRGEIGVPVTSTLGLFGAGGAGENGWAFGELGVRTFFGGTGAPGTLMLSASLGVVGIFDGPGKTTTFQDERGGEYVEYRREEVIGPSVAFGAEWRL
jgi:hypothetical protein